MAVKIMTGPVVLSFPHFAEPQPPVKGQTGKPKYSGQFVFTPELYGTDVRAGMAALEAAAIEAGEKFFGTAEFRKLVSDGTVVLFGGKGATFRTDTAKKNGYPEGSISIGARSEGKPGCVYAWPDADGKPVKVPDDKIETDLYAGAIVRVTLAAFGYDTAGNKGVSFGLNNVQKLRDGKRLDGRKAAVDEFDAPEQAPADLGAIGAE